MLSLPEIPKGWQRTAPADGWSFPAASGCPSVMLQPKPRCSCSGLVRDGDRCDPIPRSMHWLVSPMRTSRSAPHRQARRVGSPGLKFAPGSPRPPHEGYALLRYPSVTGAPPAQAGCSRLDTHALWQRFPARGCGLEAADFTAGQTQRAGKYGHARHWQKSNIELIQTLS